MEGGRERRREMGEWKGAGKVQARRRERWGRGSQRSERGLDHKRSHYQSSYTVTAIS